MFYVTIGFGSRKSTQNTDLARFELGTSAFGASATIAEAVTLWCGCLSLARGNQFEDFCVRVAAFATDNQRVRSARLRGAAPKPTNSCDDLHALSLTNREHKQIVWLPRVCNKYDNHWN